MARSERAAIDALLEGAGPQRGMLLVGEPGIGRTTLLEHARRSAAERGWRVLSARGDPAAAEHPFDAVASLVRPLEAHIPSLPPRLASALRVAWAIEAGQAEPNAIGAAVLRLVVEAAEARPVLLALDDVHWFDHSSVAALRFVHRHLDGEPVATVATALAGEPSTAAWSHALKVRTVDGLDADELQPLLGEVAVDPAVVERCRELTAGNPLGFVELVARLTPAQRSGDEPLPAIQDPGPIVTQAFAARLARLPQRARRSLIVVAADVTGRLGVVRAALDLLGSPAHLAPAEAAGIVMIDGDRISFLHPLLRAAAYHGVAPASRRKAHQALAAVLDQPRDAADRAWQLAAAADGPDEQAASALTLVAEHARSRGAVASAAQVLEQAAALSTSPALGAGRLAVAGELWLQAGELAPASAALARARSVVPAADAPLGAHLWAGVATRWTSGPRAAAADLRAAAEARAGVDREVLLAAALDEDRLAGAASTAVAFAGRATGHDDRAVLLAADVCLAGDAGAVRSVPDLVAPLEGRSPLALDAASRAGRALVHQGELLAAYRHLTVALASLATGIDGARVDAELELARVEALLGRSDDAVGRLERVAAIAAPLGMEAALRAERGVRALLALGDGRFDEAIATLAPIDRPGGSEEAALAADHVEAAVLAGRAVDAGAWRARLLAIDAAPGSLAAGQLLRAEGVVGEGPRRLEQAIDQLAPFPFEQARALLLLAERWEQPDRADEALAGFERAGAVPWAARAARAWTAGRPAEAPNPAAAALATLSTAELRVAVTVGAGRSNREAAEELYLSVKTVDHHLQHIYRKLGVRGRAELAVLVTRGSA